jgi:tetratricopeptide (TPR) repeat protein
MGMRKDQVLAVLTLLLGGWLARSLLQEPMRPSGFTPTKIDYTPAAVPVAVLVTTTAPPLARVDFCTEPSETRPLPPRELEFPPRLPLSVAGLPLDIGPDYAHMWALGIDGGPVEGVVLQAEAEAETGAEAATPAAPATPAAASGGTQEAGTTRADQEARAARTYDRIWVVGQKSPFFGTLEPDGRDLFEIEALRDFENVVVRMRIYKLSEQKFGPIVEFGKDAGNRIERIELAGTLRNEVQRRIRAVPKLASHLEPRRELIVWLLEKAREADWIYDTALEQADLYRQLSHGDLEGLRLQQRVLQARGDLAAEFALLDGLQGDHRESAFRYQGLGEIKARLGLDVDAEADLRHAVELAPNDARPHTALAEFLRHRGRSDEARVVALRAERTIGSLQNAADRGRTVRTIVACHLAVADLDAARAALQLLPGDAPQPYLTGCVSYAAGETLPALASFRSASGTTDGPAAQLGQAACLLRAGQWQEAHDLLVRIGDQDPLLRHRAATGLALLFCRLGQFDAANVWIDRALEAAPQDAYAFYLRGRSLRLQGQLAGAADAQTAALRLHDDFVHAIAEMAAVQAQRSAEGYGAEQALRRSRCRPGAPAGGRAVRTAGRLPLRRRGSARGSHRVPGRSRPGIGRQRQDVREGQPRRGRLLAWPGRRCNHRAAAHGAGPRQGGSDAGLGRRDAGGDRGPRREGDARRRLRARRARQRLGRPGRRRPAAAGGRQHAGVPRHEEREQQRTDRRTRRRGAQRQELPRRRLHHAARRQAADERGFRRPAHRDAARRRRVRSARAGRRARGRAVRSHRGRRPRRRTRRDRAAETRTRRLRPAGAAAARAARGAARRHAGPRADPAGAVERRRRPPARTEDADR